MLNTTNYTRTLWNRDSYRIPTGSNLYGYVEHSFAIIWSPRQHPSAADHLPSAHPVYYDHRGDNGTHAVFLLNSDGMFKLALHYGICQVFNIGKVSQADTPL
jgi:alpha-glucosidase